MLYYEMKYIILIVLCYTILLSIVYFIMSYISNISSKTK